MDFYKNLFMDEGRQIDDVQPQENSFPRLSDEKITILKMPYTPTKVWKTL